MAGHGGDLHDHRVRDRLLTAPAWVIGLLNGAVAGAMWVLINRVVWQETWAASALSGLLFGVVFGVITGPFQRRQWRGLREAAGRSPEGLSKRIRRAASRGPVPGDPAVRQAAHEVAVVQLRTFETQRVWGPGFLLVMAVLGVFLAVDGDPWWWVAAAAFVAAAVGHRWLLLHLRRRAEVLGR